MATRKVRYKKLSIKTALPVLREDQVDPSEYEALTSETQIATGVDQAEENEYHLQVVLQGPAAASDKDIPVPPPQESDVNYDALYSRSFTQPANYIRFSQTVEECIGCLYDMTEEDEEFVKSYNQKRPANSQLSEDDFEQIMEVFEDTASISTPYASVDKTIVPYDHMVAGLNELQLPKVMHHAKEIYEYWKSQRAAVGGPLHPALKFETHQDSDEMDPFVCFRRREVRQTRKTRARDIQSADKLKRLRRELEDGRQLVILAHEREVHKRELLRVDRAVYEQRAKLKEMKIRLGIKTDDEDLVNQKPQKKKVPELSIAQRAPGAQVRAPVRSDGRPTEMDLVQLLDALVEKENELRADVIKRIENHRRWNENHVDLTCEPLGPVKDQNVGAGFRPVKTQYLMTPPASETSNDDGTEAMELDEPAAPVVFQFRGVQQEADAAGPRLQFRRRIGRLNRLWIDRKRMPTPPRDVSPYGEEMDVNMVSDRWKYDADDSDDEPEVYEIDPYDTRALKFRASLPLPFPFQARRQELPANAAGRAGSASQPGRPAGQVRPPAAQPTPAAHISGTANGTS
ncbi:histone acetyltransferase complex component [Grosmannia clavigera kw1407]|uniref:Enhancer of polycomb-like protein n=1 Tax=Grosmannia clavigera (strain kw1407 / UAMH 11150) TaxID=655863 RepID=F0XLU6_GROCL|nr:histone acetyltransferase complex component [Grosmannia clavigera kw1407]EFX01317.1 histone acetyltransferase complex component [Grosmannia clavigera kw1407]